LPLNLIVLRVADLERAKFFYEQLGMEFEGQRHGAGVFHYACQEKHLVFELYQADNIYPTTQSIRLGFEVPNIDNTIAALKIAGFRVLRSPKQSTWGKRAVVEDTDGRRIEVIEPIRTPTPLYTD